jgi:SAM-dependent methyltransferase
MDNVIYEGRDLEVLADMPNYYGWIMETFEPFISGNIVEYGAGLGTVSRRILPLAKSLMLVEPSFNLADRLRDRFAAIANVQVKCQSLQDHVREVPTNAVDTIVMINVLEHIEDDRAALAQLLRILAPGGHLLVFVPALQILMSKIDVLHGHFRRYQKQDLIEKTKSTGFDLSACRYFDLIGVLPWLVLNKWLGNTTFNTTLINFNDKVVVPFAKFIEQQRAAPFGKNIILVARKPL